MELKDWITGVSLLLVIVGWLVSRWQDRNHEIFRERLQRRLDMFNCVVDAILPFLNPRPDGTPDVTNAKKLEAARVKMQLYGYNHERAAYEQFIACLNRRDLPGVLKSLGELTPIVTSNLRKELGYTHSD